MARSGKGTIVHLLFDACKADAEEESFAEEMTQAKTVEPTCFGKSGIGVVGIGDCVCASGDGAAVARAKLEHSVFGGFAKNGRHIVFRLFLRLCLLTQQELGGRPGQKQDRHQTAAMGQTSERPFAQPSGGYIPKMRHCLMAHLLGSTVENLGSNS